MLTEHVHCVAVTLNMTEQVEKRICVKLSLNIPLQKLLDDSEGCSYGQLVIGSFITTTHLLVHHVLCRVFWQNIKSPR